MLRTQAAWGWPPGQSLDEIEENREAPAPDDDCVSGANSRSTTEKTAQVLNSYFRTITISKPIGPLPSVIREDNFCEYAKGLVFSRNPFKFHTFLFASILLSGTPPDGGISVTCGAQSALPRAPFCAVWFCRVRIVVGGWARPDAHAGGVLSLLVAMTRRLNRADGHRSYRRE